MPDNTLPATQIAKVQPAAPAMGLAPTNMSEAVRYAQAAVDSKMFGMTSVPQVLMIVSLADAMGIHPARALTSIHIINNRPCMSADLQVALVKTKKEICGYFKIIESTDEHAVVETHRVGDPEPTRRAFTMKEAERAGLLKNEMWRKYPQRMLLKRAQAFLARDVYPDLLAGIYDPDEILRAPAPLSREQPVPAANQSEVVQGEFIAEAQDDELMRQIQSAETQEQLNGSLLRIAALRLSHHDPRRVQYVEAISTAKARVAQESV